MYTPVDVAAIVGHAAAHVLAVAALVVPVGTVGTYTIPYCERQLDGCAKHLGLPVAL